MSVRMLLGIFSLFFVMGCAKKNDFSSKDLKSDEFIYWVNSSTQECMGVGSMTCLQIQKGEKMVEGNWTLFYNQIEGFVYEPGYVYKLVVKEEHLDPELLPADVSSIQYKLVKLLEKKRG